MAAGDNLPRLVTSNQAIYSDMATSSLFTMIPHSVRSRIPVLTSLRATARAAMLQRSPSFRRKPDTWSSLDDSKELDGSGFVSTASNSGVSTPMTRPQTPDEATRTSDLSLTLLPQSEAQSGINWDVASTGVRLWIAAKSQAEQNGDPMALRSMFIDAMRYMNMALPTDLTPLEIECLRASMSPLVFRNPSDKQDRDLNPQRGPPTALRRLIAQIICWVFALFSLVLPIVMQTLNHVFQFERQHQLTEKVLSNSLDLGVFLGEPGSRLQTSMVRFKGSPLGGACVNAGAWVVDGIIGGVNDGFDSIAQGRTAVV